MARDSDSIILMAMRTTAAVLMLWGALLVLISYGKFRFVRTRENTLLLNMTCSDLGLSLSMMVSAVLGVSHNYGNTSPSLCVLSKNAVGGFQTISLLSLVLIMLERYIKVEHPLRFPSLVNKNTIAGALSVTWAVPILLVILRAIAQDTPEDVSPADASYLCISGFLLYTEGYQHLLLGVLSFRLCVIALVSILFVRLARIILRHRRQIQNIFRNVSVDISPVPSTKRLKWLGCILALLYISAICTVVDLCLDIYDVPGRTIRVHVTQTILSLRPSLNVFTLYVHSRSLQIALRRLLRCHGNAVGISDDDVTAVCPPAVPNHTSQMHPSSHEANDRIRTLSLV